MGKIITIGLTAAIVIMCVVMAFYFALTDIMSDRLFGTKRTALIIVLCCYALYRIYRLYVTLKKN
jgi:hypothetical protein